MKAPITPNFLSKQDGKHRHIYLLDFVTLINSLVAGYNDNDIGNGDLVSNWDSVQKSLNRAVTLDPSFIENCVWAANMLDEKNKFKDIKGRTFTQFVTDLIGNKASYDRNYGLINWKG